MKFIYGLFIITFECKGKGIRQLYFKRLEEALDQNKWYIDENGIIRVLYKNFYLRDLDGKTFVFKGDDTTRISRDIVKLKSQLALDDQKNRCEYCWKLVARINFNHHHKMSCENSEAHDIRARENSQSHGSTTFQEKKHSPFTTLNISTKQSESAYDYVLPISISDD